MARMSHLVPRLIAIAAVTAMPLLLINCREVASSAVNAPSYFRSYERHADLAYGALPRQSLDVYAPRGAVDRPVIFFWHGGSWVYGDKAEARFVGAVLAEAGYVVVVPNYRLIPHIRFPHFIDDSALAVKWGRGHARDFGGDPNAIFVMGHSAGGYLAAMLAMALPVRSKTLENVKGFIEAVVAGARLHEPGVVCPPLDGRKAPIGGPPRIPTRTARSG